MNYNNKIQNTFKGVLLLLAVFIGLSQFSNAQCTYCSATTSYEDEYISGVYIGDISNTSTWQGGVANYTNKSTNVMVGQSYNIKVTNGNAWSGDLVSVFVDWNKDCDFDDANETFALSTSDGAKTFTGSITVPSNASGGTTRMRIRMTYYTTPSPCGSSNYGEVEDYSLNVILPAPDAAVLEIIPPTYPYTEGTYPVSAKFGNLGDGNVGSFTVNWSVNGVSKTPINWSGLLKKNENVTLQLGTHAFLYPDGGPYNPFTIDVWLTNIVGSGTTLPDADASNNSKSAKTAPATEDAGPVAITQPSGSFTPGMRDIVVRIQNYARKPLTVLDIDWYVDGVKKGTKKWFGSLTQNQTADVVVGQFNFQFKTPLAPYEIKAVTLNPNGVSDPNTANDEYSTFKAPSLVAGTYVIGGSNAHFPTFAEAAQYLGSSGILGDGPVVFNIAAGTYNEQVTINDFAHGNNTFTFQSATGYASDVVLNATANSGNWALGINGLDNVIIRNLTIKVNQGTSAGANAIWANGSENLLIENVALTGVTNPTKTNNFAVVYLNDISNATIKNSTINNGSHGVYFNSYSPNYKFTGSKFNNYNAYAIFQEDYYGGGIVRTKETNNKIQATYSVVVDNNEFVGTTIPGTGGVWLTSNAKIANNTFVNFNTTSPNNAVIMINDPNYGGSLIENNSISNATGARGIVVMSFDSKILKNTISVATGNYSVAGIMISGKNIDAAYNKVVISGNTSSYGIAVANSNGGIVANNLVNASGPIAIYANNNNGTGFYYNTFVTTSTNTASLFQSGNNNFKRNLVMNYGTGRSVINSNSNVQSANNNFFTKGTTNATDLNSWFNLTGDATTSNANIQLTDDGTYQFVQFVESSVTYSSLGIGDEYELYDFYGMKRDGFYYTGYAGIELEITILKQPKPIMACNGETNRQIDLAASISYGATAQYQWYKDGNPIPGATNPVYKFATFNYETAGNYKCRIYGPANTAQGIFSTEVLVYTLRPTEITKQPTTVKAKINGTVFFEIEAHTKGITPPLFQHRYQWYRRYNGQDVQLIDNENYANTRSPIMTITKLQDKHFNGAVDDYYFIEVEGQCGIIRSKPITLEMIASDVAFKEQPKNTEVCLAGTAKFTADAEVPGSNELILYQWFKDGSELKDDARITGTKTAELKIANVIPTDAGTYYVVAKGAIGESTKTSEKATLTVNSIPVFDTNPKDVTVKEKQQITLTVEVSGTEPFTYQWYKDDFKIDGATNKTFIIQEAALENSGFYTCEATNVCGKTKSSPAQVVVEKAGGVTSVTDNDVFNMQVTPNPVKSDINIAFELDAEGAIEISILDVTGRTIHTFNAQGVSGLNNVSLDITNKVANGTYFVKIQNGNKSSIKQIVIAK